MTIHPREIDPPPGCPHCFTDPANWVGVEIRGVYDGVLYWECMRCHRATPRHFPTGSRHRQHSERFAERHNKAVQIREGGSW
jgi:hypothetical protein